jgi:uncharacterized protein DUF748
MDASLRHFWTTFSEQAVRFRRSRLFWIALALGAVILLAIIASYPIDEPLRRQTEAKINGALKGYTVRIGRLDFHPIGFSLDLEDMLIVQNADPDPPVARIPNLTARVDWKALVFGRVVAYFEIDDPVLSINLTHFERERRDDTKLHERGWQQALQAIYPLEINEFVVANARLTYTDRGPYRPLEVRNLNFIAHNIRNVRSSPGEYPSAVHLDGAVFEKGQVELNGYADFLAEPHAAFKAGVAFSQIDLSYFRPITDRYHFDVRSGVFSTQGTMEYAANKKILDVPEVRVDRLVADYIHVKPETSPTKEISKKTAQVIKETSNEPSLDVRLNKVRIADAELGMINKTANPEYRLFVVNTQIQVDNLSNQEKDGVATARATGLFMGSGKLQASARFIPKGKSPNFDFQLAVEDADLRALNKLFLATGNFDVADGRFSLYTEITVRGGAVDGYVKPLFRDVKVYDPKQDRNKNIFRKMYEGIIAGLSWILENPERDEVATTTRISGKLSNPQMSTWDVIVGLVQNAFFRAILPGLERSVETGRKSNK